jgi:hypothetical protein
MEWKYIKMDIPGVLARGYCAKENSHKVLDPDLIKAMAVEVEKWIEEFIEITNIK